MVKAVFFDFDGVLSDSKIAHDTAWLSAIKSILNVEIDNLPSDKISGKAPLLIAKTLCDLYGNGSEYEDLLNFKNKDLNNNLQIVKPFEGVEQLFKILKSKNIPFGVASNASKHFVSQCLLNWGLDVEVSYGYEDYISPKPNPEPYLKLADFFSIDNSDFKDVLVFEDSETGLKSAIASGMTPIHIKSYSKVSSNTMELVNYSFNNVLEASGLINDISL